MFHCIILSRIVPNRSPKTVIYIDFLHFRSHELDGEEEKFKDFLPMR